jgi:hypothetical protein
MTCYTHTGKSPAENIEDVISTLLELHLKHDMLKNGWRELFLNLPCLQMIKRSLSFRIKPGLDLRGRYIII